MQAVDRLTTLMERFALRVCPAPLPRAELVVTAAGGGEVSTIHFGVAGIGADLDPDLVLLAAAVDWGGAANPLMAALPDRSAYDLANDTELAALVGLIRAEIDAARCGSASVVNRLGEVLIVRLLRARIEAGSTRPGLLAGLSDPRLSRALVAIHDRPGREWRNDDLAAIAGLSLSRFAEYFAATVGQTPAAYLRQWRLTLARQDLQKGDRVDAVSRRYGYGSPEGFARAFRRRFGSNPLAMRPPPAVRDQSVRAG